MLWVIVFLFLCGDIFFCVGTFFLLLCGHIFLLCGWHFFCLGHFFVWMTYFDLCGKPLLPEYRSNHLHSTRDSFTPDLCAGSSFLFQVFPQNLEAVICSIPFADEQMCKLSNIQLCSCAINALKWRQLCPGSASQLFQRCLLSHKSGEVKTPGSKVFAQKVEKFLAQP